MHRKKIQLPSELTAKEIQKQYHVSRSTAWRAAKRGWLWQNYHGDDSQSVKESIEKQFIRLANNPAITYGQLTSLKPQKIYDIMHGKSSLRQDEWKTFKAEWVQLRNLMRKFVDVSDHDYKVKRLKAIVNDARIHQLQLLGDRILLDRLRKDLEVSVHQIRKAENRIQTFLNKTTVGNA